MCNFFHQLIEFRQLLHLIEVQNRIEQDSIQDHF